ncbi:MAG: response regulator [Anaerolineae bacterium]|jgi:DNA-binding NtrC family response regulator|nr:response regulator [Anaerolineae bacterium]
MKNKPLNILVVDDDHNFAHTLCAILQSEGYECSEVHSVSEARQLLMRKQIDFILSDIKMQEQSGPDLYYQIKEKFPAIPFVLMTAYTSSEVIEQALAAGVLAAFQKPIDIKSLLRFFADLNRSLQAAVISEDLGICAQIQAILENKKFSFLQFNSIQNFLLSNRFDIPLVFIDAQDYSEHFATDINSLLERLPENTIVIICDFKRSAGLQAEYADILNLIVLPRNHEIAHAVESIVQEQFLTQARKSIALGE